MAILVSYMYRGGGRRNFDPVGEGRLNAPGKRISRKNDTDRKFPFSEEFMRLEKDVKHHSYLMCKEANFLLGEHKIAI